MNYTIKATEENNRLPYGKKISLHPYSSRFILLKAFIFGKTGRVLEEFNKQCSIYFIISTFLIIQLQQPQ